MNVIKRQITDSISANIRKGKIIVLFGARQVGKTTLLSELEKSEKGKVLKLNCDNEDDRLILENKSSTELYTLLSPYNLVLIDEVQRVQVK